MNLDTGGPAQIRNGHDRLSESAITRKASPRSGGGEGGGSENYYCSGSTRGRPPATFGRMSKTEIIAAFANLSLTDRRRNPCAPLANGRGGHRTRFCAGHFMCPAHKVSC